MAAPAHRRRGLLVAGVAVVAAIAALLWWRFGGDPAQSAAPAKPAALRADREPGVMRLIDGTWQRVDPRDPRAGITIPSRVADGMVRVEGKVYELDKAIAVVGVEVVFSGSTGEATTMTDTDGRYRVDLEPGTYRAFVRGDGVLSIGPRLDDRLPAPPQPGVAGLPDDQIAPALTLVEDQRGIDLPVVRGGTISGKVVDAGGRPIRGAVVRAIGSPIRPVLGTDLAETGADGSYRLDVPVGGYRLEAAHPAYAGIAESDDTAFVAVDVGRDTERDLTLIAGCVIEGKVVLARGGPAADGAIEKQFGPTGNDFAPAGKIDADGGFRWTTTDPQDVVLRAWPWKSPPSESRSFACKDGARFSGVVFTVPDRDPDIAGVVVSADGKPVPFAFLDITALTAGGLNQQERADADGRWGVYAMPPGDYRIQVFVPEGGVVNTIVTAPVSGLELRLSGVGSIAGAVKGIDTGSFTLELGGCDDGSGRNDRVRRTIVVPVRAGNYRVDGIPACAQPVVAHGLDRQQVDGVTVEANGVAKLDLDLSPRKRKTITGVVTGPDGMPVEGATVTAAYGDDAARDETDAAGRFSIQTYAGEGIYAYKGSMQAFAMVGEADVPEERVDLRIEDVSGSIDIDE
jgi:hypothetical protein